MSYYVHGISNNNLLLIGFVLRLKIVALEFDLHIDIDLIKYINLYYNIKSNIQITRMHREDVLNENIF